MSMSVSATSLSGTGELARLAVRRDRILLPAWVYVIVVAVSGTAYTFKKLYPTAAGREALAASGGGNAALRFLYGRLSGSSIGELTTWRYGIWAVIFAVLMTVFVVVRHTRADEEAGRLELIGSVAVGRHAPLFAALLTAAMANLLIGLLLSAALSALGLPASGAVAFGASVAACGLAFTGVCAVAAQLVTSARAARGLAIAVLGLAFVLRGVGDVAEGSGGVSWLSWLSPLGWIGFIRPFGVERWWVLALPLLLAAGLAALAFLLAARRDYDAGVLPDRAGRATAAAWLRDPFALAWRLQRGTLLAWAFGYAATFAASGAAAKGIGSLLGSSTALRNEFTRLGGQAMIVNAYLSALILLAGLAAAAYAVSVLLRLRAEETGGLAEPVLATAIGRVRWAAGYLAMSVAGVAVLLAMAALMTGLGYGIPTSSVSTQVPRLLGAAFGQLPAVLVILAVAMLAFGALPEACTAAAWSVVGAVVFLMLFGQALSLSHWVLDISPFTHVPRLTGGPPGAAALLWLLLTAAALTVAGLLALRRRDLT